MGEEELSAQEKAKVIEEIQTQRRQSARDNYRTYAEGLDDATLAGEYDKYAQQVQAEAEGKAADAAVAEQANV